MSKTALPKIALRSAIATLLLPALAHAQEETDGRRLRGSAAIGVAAFPDYEGADEHRIVPLVNGRLELGNRYAALEGTSLRVNLIALDGIEFGPVANLTFGRDRKIESAAVARLGKIDDAYEVGAFAAYSVPVAGNDRIRVALQAVHDVSDVHDGYVATASAGYTAIIGNRALVNFNLAASYAGDDYAGTYFSVSPAGSAASGLPGYVAKGGLKDAGASLTGTYRVTGNWSLVGYAGYRRLLGDFADGPVVAREGNADQFSGGIGIAFSF